MSAPVSSDAKQPETPAVSAPPVQQSTPVKPEPIQTEAPKRKGRKKVSEMTAEEKAAHDLRIKKMREAPRRDANQLKRDHVIEFLLENDDEELARYVAGNQKVYEEKDLFIKPPKRALTKKQIRRYNMTQYLGRKLEENKKRIEVGEQELDEDELVDEYEEFQKFKKKQKLAKTRQKPVKPVAAPPVEEEEDDGQPEESEAAQPPAKEAAAPVAPPVQQVKESVPAQRKRKEPPAAASTELKQPPAPVQPRPPVEPNRVVTSNQALRPLTNVPTVNLWNLPAKKAAPTWR